MQKLNKTIPVIEKHLTIPRLLTQRAKTLGDKTILIIPESKLKFSYHQFWKAVNKMSNFLLAHQVGHGDRVSILLENSYEFLLSYFGSMQIGAIACPLNTKLKANELSYIIENSESGLLLTDSTFLHTYNNDIVLSKMRRICLWDKYPGIAPEICIDQIREMVMRQSVNLNSDPNMVQPDDVAQIIYTSGTTGKPKGVCLSHHNLVVNCHHISYWLGLTGNDRAMCVMPLFHVNGEIITTLTPLYIGGSIVLPRRFGVTTFFPMIEQYNVTYTGTVATMLSMLLNKYENEEEVKIADSLRMVLCGSAPVPLEVQMNFERKFYVPVVEGYGMTETTCRSTFNLVVPKEYLKSGHIDDYRKLGSAGLPLGNELKIVDEQDHALGANKIGEIVVRGENVMSGYYKNTKATEEAFRGGWFHTGDLGYLDDDGYIHIVDRKTDMIIRAGENIYPREIDDILYRHPAIKEAVSIGVPDPLYNEEIVAYVVKKEGKAVDEKEIIEFCRLYLADYKCPKKIIFIDDIPKSQSGKLLRRELRNRTH